MKYKIGYKMYTLFDKYGWSVFIDSEPKYKDRGKAKMVGNKMVKKIKEYLDRSK